MRKALTILLIILPGTGLFSQTRVLSVYPFMKYKDSLVVVHIPVNSYDQVLQGQDNMPVYNNRLPMPAYKGNNGNGADMYESSVDRMPLLVPDKSATTHMPGSRYPKLKDFYQQPGDADPANHLPGKQLSPNLRLQNPVPVFPKPF